MTPQQRHARLQHLIDRAVLLHELERIAASHKRADAEALYLRFIVRPMQTRPLRGTPTVPIPIVEMDTSVEG